MKKEDNFKNSNAMIAIMLWFGFGMLFSLIFLVPEKTHTTTVIEVLLPTEDSKTKRKNKMGEKQECNLWYSHSQAMQTEKQDGERIYYKTTEGQIVRITEAKIVDQPKKPGGLWEDYEYLGTGFFSQTEHINQADN